MKTTSTNWVGKSVFSKKYGEGTIKDTIEFHDLNRRVRIEFSHGTYSSFMIDAWDEKSLDQLGIKLI